MVELFACVCVAKKTVGMPELSRQSHAEFFCNPAVITGRRRRGISRPILRHDAQASGIQRRKGAYVDLPSHCVAAVENRLRSPEYFYAFDIG